MTFNDVGLSDDGFEFNGSSSEITTISGESVVGKRIVSEFSIITKINPIEQPRGRYDYNCVIFNLRKNITNSVPDSLNEIALYIRYEDMYVRCCDEYIPVSESYPISEIEIAITVKNNLCSIYKNGNLFIEKTINNDWLIDSTVFYIGRVGADIDKLNFMGSMRFLDMYNRALTPQEISDRYQKNTFLFLNDTPTPTQQEYIDWQDGLKIGRQ
jgi:hypothetical protein